MKISLRTLIVASLFVLLVGCAGQAVFVTARDVPEKPTVVVIPAYNRSQDVIFANGIESAVVQVGLSVIQRPMEKRVETTSGASAVAGGVAVENRGLTGAAKSDLKSVKESYFAFDETSADYVVFAYADTKRLKIFKRSTAELLTSFHVRGSGTQETQFIENVFGAFKALGLKVRVAPTGPPNPNRGKW